MSIDDKSYFRVRAKQELAAAGHATCPSIGAIHTELAKLYLAKASGPVDTV